MRVLFMYEQRKADMQTTTERTAPVYATKKGVALFPQDIEDVERIRDHFDLDSFSQALRRAIACYADRLGLQVLASALDLDPELAMEFRQRAGLSRFKGASP